MSNSLSLLIIFSGTVGLGIIFGIIAGALSKKFPKAKWYIIGITFLLAAAASFGWGWLAGIIIK